MRTMMRHIRTDLVDSWRKMCYCPPLPKWTINASKTWCVSVRASLHMRKEEKQTRCHWMVYCTYNMLIMFRALLCPSWGARDYVLLPPMVCDALVVCCWRSGAGQPAMRSGWGTLLEQHPSFRMHSQLPCTWSPTTNNQGTTHHRR